MKDYFKKLKQLLTVKDLVFAVLLFSIMIGLAFCQGENLVEITFGDAAVDIVSSKYSMNIPYDMVESVELAEICDDDDLVNGVADIALRTGVWTGETWGEYNACVDVQTGNCIAVHLDDGRTFVFSSKSEKITTEAYEELLSHLSK